jgi:hypothetical protein
MIISESESEPVIKHHKQLLHHDIHIWCELFWAEMEIPEGQTNQHEKKFWRLFGEVLSFGDPRLKEFLKGPGFGRMHEAEG